ncbi:glycosyltransferase family 2 protein [uncultured Microbulbifer sp.]|uniref:glycosyltransferase family 2 protein n=1 Tax=uncultured Microbulbifer sp. TaxID=348147 RepID=UPI0026282907|nr:glycosyltransferase family 2 protein [uncultured Microbulbifer sp.]
MKVSIITVSYNSEETIRETIASVLFQDYPKIEYIIVDGGSKDRTMKIVSEYEERIYKIISESDKGIYDAMNKGINFSSGEVVGLLNSDDVYSNRSVISEVVRYLSQGNVDAVFADLEIVSKKLLTRRRRLYSSKRFRPYKFRWGWMPAHPTFFVKKICYKKFGLYRTDLNIAADFELLVRFLYRNQVSYVYIPRCLVTMRGGGASASGLWGVLFQNIEIVRACRENGIYTNIFLVALKIPVKIFEYFR